MSAGLETRTSDCRAISSEAWPRPTRPGGERYVQGETLKASRLSHWQVSSPRLPRLTRGVALEGRTSEQLTMTIARPMFPPVDSTRRRFLSHAAGVAAGGTALALATMSATADAAAPVASLAPSGVDPIFALIEEYRSTAKTLNAATSEHSRREGMLIEQGLGLSPFISVLDVRGPGPAQAVVAYKHEYIDRHIPADRFSEPNAAAHASLDAQIERHKAIFGDIEDVQYVAMDAESAALDTLIWTPPPIETGRRSLQRYRSGPAAAGLSIGHRYPQAWREYSEPAQTTRLDREMGCEAGRSRGGRTTETSEHSTDGILDCLGLCPGISRDQDNVLSINVAQIFQSLPKVEEVAQAGDVETRQCRLWGHFQTSGRV